jgi:hypothetical protein
VVVVVAAAEKDCVGSKGGLDTGAFGKVMDM